MEALSQLTKRCEVRRSTDHRESGPDVGRGEEEAEVCASTPCSEESGEDNHAGGEELGLVDRAGELERDARRRTKVRSDGLGLEASAVCPVSVSHLTRSHYGHSRAAEVKGIGVELRTRSWSFCRHEELEGGCSLQSELWYVRRVSALSSR